MTARRARNADEWESLTSRSFVPISCHPATVRFGGTIDTHELSDSVSVTRLASGPVLVQRTAAQIAQSSADTVHLSLQVSSRGSIAQNGKRTEVRRRTMTLYRTSQPYVLDYRFPQQHHIVAQLPARALGLSERSLDDASLQAIDAGSGGRRIFARHLSAVIDDASALSELERADLSRVTTDLASAMLRGSLSSTVLLPRTDEAMLAAMKAYLREHSEDSGLTLDDVARAHCISRRKLFQLFQSGGQSPSTFLRDERLTAAERLFRERGRTVTVTEVAHTVGFGDAATFTRAFRKRNGRTPRDWLHDSEPSP